MNDRFKRRTGASANDVDSGAAWHPIYVGGMVEPECIRFDEHAFEQEFFALANIVCPPRIAAAAHKRQAAFFFGRLCAKAVLAKLGLTEVQVGVGMAREPVWPAGIVGSITHCDTIAAAVALPKSACSGIGIDIETVAEDAAVIDALRACAVSGFEQRYLAQWETTLGSALPILLVFSAKESFFKALFGAAGRYFDFDAIELEELDLRANVLVFRLREQLTLEWTTGCRCRIGFQLLDRDHIFTMFAW